MQDELRVEVDRNYDFFQRNLARILADHSGQYALIKSAAIVEFHQGPGEAYRAGLTKFPDRIFSIQKVTEEMDDLGMMSLVLL